MVDSKQRLSPNILGNATILGDEKTDYYRALADWIEKWCQSPHFTLTTQTASTLTATLRSQAMLIDELLSDGYSHVMAARLLLHHRHLLQTTCYNHLLLLRISRKEKTNSSRLGTPLSLGLRNQKDLRPFDHYRIDSSPTEWSDWNTFFSIQSDEWRPISCQFKRSLQFRKNFILSVILIKENINFWEEVLEPDNVQSTMVLDEMRRS